MAELSACRSWHAVRTRPGREGDVAITAEAAGMAVFPPLEFVRLSYRGSRRSEVRWRPLFTGHLFVQFDPGRDLQSVLEIHGVDDVVKPNGKLASVDPEVIAAIRSAERRGLFDAAGDCRRPNGDAAPPDPRHAGLVQRIRSSRYSRERMALLMSLLS
jgi:hypothetical protein